MNRYERYKGTDLEWIDEIPKHWECVRVKHLVTTKVTDGPHETPNFVDEGIPFLSVEGVVGNKIDFNQVRGYITLEAHDIYSQKCKPQRGDVLLVKSGSTTGKSTIVETDLDFNIWSPLCILRSDSDMIDPYFMFNSVQSGYFRTQVETSWSYGTQPNIGMGVVENLWIVVPLFEEQKLISRYLDKKTEKIDSLIEKIQKKIELLKEQRTSLINQCVTKGLDPNVEMKDSGIEWIGEIPKHWKVIRLRFLIVDKPSNGIFKKKELFGSGVPLVNVSDIYTPNFLIDDQTLDFVECDDKEKDSFKVKNGDQFFIRSSLKLEGIGASSMFVGNVPTVFECHIVKVTPNRTQIEPRFLNFYLNSLSCRQWFIKSSQTVTMTTISQDPIKNIIIILPPVYEQRQIIKQLEERFGDISNLISKNLSKIDLLKEYRQSLISSAVTGKVRVTEDMI